MVLDKQWSCVQDDGPGEGLPGLAMLWSPTWPSRGVAARGKGPATLQDQQVPEQGVCVGWGRAGPRQASTSMLGLLNRQ